MKNKPYPLYSLPAISDLKDMVNRRAENTPNDIAFSYSEKKNKTVSKTCREFADDINALGTYLFHNGFKGKHIAIIGENSYEWLTAFLAIVNGGNIAVPIDKELPKEKVGELLRQSDCKAVFISKNYMDLVCDNEELTLFSMADFNKYISVGKLLIKNGNNEYTDFKIDVNQCTAIFFTSGTTGQSKGVCLSQKNMVYNIGETRKYDCINGCVLSVLPYHHAFGLIIGVFSVYCFGSIVYVNKSLKRLSTDIQIAKPTAIALVPLYIETFYKTILDTANKNGKIKKLKRAVKISHVLLSVGIDFRPKIFAYIQSFFGGNLRYIVCGGAALDIKYVKAFREWGINILNGYGITECSPVVSVNRNYYWRDGSVGQVLCGCEVKIAEDKEILIKGDNVMLGYYKDERATKSVLHDGWYHTGDLGYMDKDGFLFITGRKKNLIILSNGENVSPEELEMLIMKLSISLDTFISKYFD
jgi:long-chain acyl-CoA synthetase